MSNAKPGILVRTLLVGAIFAQDVPCDLREAPGKGGRSGGRPFASLDAFVDGTAIGGRPQGSPCGLDECPFEPAVTVVQQPSMDGFSSRGEGGGDKAGIGGELSRGGESGDGVDFQGDCGGEDSADSGDSHQEVHSGIIGQQLAEIFLGCPDQGVDLFQQSQALREDLPVNPFQV